MPNASSVFRHLHLLKPRANDSEIPSDTPDYAFSPVILLCKWKVPFRVNEQASILITAPTVRNILFTRTTKIVANEIQCKKLCDERILIITNNEVYNAGSNCVNNVTPSSTIWMHNFNENTQKRKSGIITFRTDDLIDLSRKTLITRTRMNHTRMTYEK
jgi:hypothetical protein